MEHSSNRRGKSNDERKGTCAVRKNLSPGDIKRALTESDSVQVRGQLNVADEGETLLNSGGDEDSHERLFDQLPSLRIAREYLRREIAAEREMLERRNQRN
ncbi:hypothetical protein KIN20_006533 [Parelaphostrongylus tenuis]|uniref:Uncharacterized protein n=1 Tax=Parelaphostrongylus tenuis TaxID=148309 RepID=A0AAD5MK97_PARTN|nr:hypothetical protein KIN20_006533 [Parelaphostrongylus tenuis]